MNAPGDRTKTATTTCAIAPGSIRAARLAALAIALVTLAFPRIAGAQTVCIPGTNICWQGKGGAGGKAGGGAQGGGTVGPGGAQGNAGAGGQAQGGAQGQQSGSSPTPQNPPPPPPAPTPPPPAPTPPPPAPVPVPVPPPTTPPVVPAPPPSGSPGYYSGRGSYDRVGGIALGLCGGARIGIYSGVRGGGCILIGGRGRRWGFDAGFMPLYGGNVPSLDLSIISDVILRIGPKRHGFSGLVLLAGPEFRFGFPRAVDAQIFHLGSHIGAGYELPIGSIASFRILDARFYGAVRTDSVPVADDLDGRRYDIGFLLTTGLVLYNPQQ